MRNTLLSIALCLCLPAMMSGQSVDKKTFEEAVDYINCKLAELSFKDQVRQPNLAEYQKVTAFCNLSEEDNDFYQKILLAFLESKKDLQKNVALAKSVNTLKTNYKANYDSDEMSRLVLDTLMKKVFIANFIARHQSSYITVEPQLKKTITESFARGDVEFVPTDEGVAERDVINFRDTSRNNYSNLDGKGSNAEIEHDDFEERPDENSPEYDSDGSKTFFEKYSRVILLLILGFALVYFWFSRYGGSFFKIKKPEILGSTTKGVDNAELAKIKTQLEGLKSTSSSLQEEMSLLRYRFEELENQLDVPTFEEEEEEDFDNQYDNHEITQEDILEIETPADKAITFNFEEEGIEEDIEAETETDIIANSTENAAANLSFFMTIPDANGHFDETQATENFKRPISVYQFKVISKDGNQAEFVIYQDIATMIRALDNFEEYLKPACRSNSILHKNATKINTVEKGLAIKEGNRWRVIQKAVISYS